MSQARSTEEAISRYWNWFQLCESLRNKPSPATLLNLQLNLKLYLRDLSHWVHGFSSKMMVLLSFRESLIFSPRIKRQCLSLHRSSKPITGTIILKEMETLAEVWLRNIKYSLVQKLVWMDPISLLRSPSTLYCSILCIPT